MKSVPIFLVCMLTGAAWAQNSSNTQEPSLEQAFSEATSGKSSTGSGVPAPVPVSVAAPQTAAQTEPLGYVLASFHPVCSQKYSSDDQTTSRYPKNQPIWGFNQGDIFTRPGDDSILPMKITRYRQLEAGTVSKSKNKKKTSKEDSSQMYDTNNGRDIVGPVEDSLTGKSLIGGPDDVNPYSHVGWYDKSYKNTVVTPEINAKSNTRGGGAIEQFFDGCQCDPLTNICAGDAIALHNIGKAFSLPSAMVLDIDRRGENDISLTLVAEADATTSKSIAIKPGDIFQIDLLSPSAYYVDSNGQKEFDVANGIAEVSATETEPIWRYGERFNGVSYSVELPGKYANCVNDGSPVDKSKAEVSWDMGADVNCKRDGNGNVVGLADYTVMDSDAVQACKEIGGSLPTRNQLDTIRMGGYSLWTSYTNVGNEPQKFPTSDTGAGDNEWVNRQLPVLCVKP